VLQEPEFRERLAAVGFEPMIQSPEDMQKLIAADSVKYGAIVKAMNISLD